MTPLIAPALEEYAARHSDPEPPLLNELRRYTETHCEDAQMLVGPLQGALLKLLTALSGGRRVLELGCFTGYSALWMAEGLQPDGVLITCEIDADRAAIARSFWARSPLGERIELRLGPALDTLGTLSGPFDLVFLDADKENYIHYWDAVVPMVRPGGLIAADNVLWSGRVLTPQHELDRVLARFNEHVLADARVERVLLTVRDGLLLARRRG
jgi:caffeoyl-CoA O-methyltransferase